MHPTTAALLALLALPAHAYAQPAQNPAPGARPDHAADPAADLPAEVTDPAGAAPTFTITATGIFTDRADLDDGPGDLRISRARLGVQAGFDLGDRRSLAVGIGAERSWYDFDDATDLDAGGDPFGDVTDAELFLRYSAPFNDATSWFGLAAIGIAAEDGADISDSFVYTGSLGFITRASESFSWGLGVLVRTQLEDDALVIPVPQIRWAIDDKWTLESQRAGLRLDYAHSESFSYGLQAEYVSRSYRLDDNGPIPDGTATDRRVPISFYADYEPAPAFSIGAAIGASVYSNIELLDSGGDDIADDDIDTALFFSLTARVRF
jgi:hypothetical protein